MYSVLANGIFFDVTSVVVVQCEWEKMTGAKAGDIERCGSTTPPTLVVYLLRSL